MSSTVPEGAYQIWGFEANANFDDLNEDVNSKDQVGGDQELRCVYATDDIDEARKIMRNGGFFREDGETWVVAREGRKAAGNG